MDIKGIKNIKVGDMFLVDSRELSNVTISRSGDFHITSINQANNYVYDEKIGAHLLIRYIGNNLCEEYFTGELLHLFANLDKDNPSGVYFEKINSFNGYKNQLDYFIEFNKINQKCLKYPLGVEARSIWDISSRSLAECGIDGDKAKNSVYYLKEVALKEYMESFKKFIIFEHDNALAEYMIYDFKKRSLKKEK